MRKVRLQGALLPCWFGNIIIGPSYRGLHGHSRYRDLASVGGMPALRAGRTMRTLHLALLLGLALVIGGTGAAAVYTLTALPYL